VAGVADATGTAKSASKVTDGAIVAGDGDVTGTLGTRWVVSGGLVATNSTVAGVAKSTSKTVDATLVALDCEVHGTASNDDAAPTPDMFGTIYGRLIANHQWATRVPRRDVPLP
jgi:hypothetical protein